VANPGICTTVVKAPPVPTQRCVLEKPSKSNFYAFGKRVYHRRRADLRRSEGRAVPEITTDPRRVAESLRSAWTETPA